MASEPGDSGAGSTVGEAVCYCGLCTFDDCPETRQLRTALDAARAEIEQSKARFDEFRSLSAGMVGERFAELRVELQRAQARLAAQERVIKLVRAEHEDNWASSVCGVCAALRGLDGADAANTTMPRPDSGC